MERPTRYLTTREVADRLAVHLQTLRRWERDGVVPPATRRRGRRVYSADDVARIMASVLETPATAVEMSRA